MRRDRFKKGQSTFKCRSCGKLTRDVSGNGSVELCELCDAKSGCGNSLSDAGYKGDAWGKFDACATVDECHALLTAELERLAVANAASDDDEPDPADAYEFHDVRGTSMDDEPRR